MQLKDVTPIIKAILEERDKIPRIIDKERYIPNPQPYHDGNFMRGGIRKALRIIEQAPVVDTVPVAHGKWEAVTVEAYFVPTIEEKTKRDFPCCSRCHQIQSIDAWTKPFNYCPNCGIPMDGGASDAAD